MDALRNRKETITTKRIAILHTVRSVYETFAAQFRDALSSYELDIIEMLDEFLVIDTNRRGAFTLENRNRLLYLLKAADLEDADLIITSCSTLTPCVEQIRSFIHTPVLAIDDAMMERAVTCGSRITLVATAASAVGPARQKLLSEAEKAGQRLEFQEILCTDAFRAMQNRDKAAHDGLLLEIASQIDRSADAVLLAQASMAHLEQDIARICGRTTLSSPRLCFERAELILFGEDH